MSRIITRTSYTTPRPVRFHLGPISKVVVALDGRGYWTFSRSGGATRLVDPTYTYQPTPYGLGRRTNTEGIIIGATGDVGTTSGGFIFSRMKTTTASTHGPGIRVTGTNAERCSVHLPWSDGSVYWDYGGVTTGRLSATASEWGAEPTYKPTTWGFYSGSRQLEIWKDGRLVKRGGTAVTRTAAGGGFYDNKWDASGIGFAGVTGIYILLDGDASEWFMSTLTANPYLVFANNSVEEEMVNLGLAAPYSYMDSYITWG